MRKEAKGQSAGAMVKEPSRMRSRQNSNCSSKYDIYPIIIKYNIALFNLSSPAYLFFFTPLKLQPNDHFYSHCGRIWKDYRSCDSAIILARQSQMFRRNNEESAIPLKLTKEAGSGSLNKLRILDGLPLRRLNDSDSNHSSVMASSLHNSMKNIGNSSIASSQFSMRSSLLRPSPEKKTINRQESIQQLLQHHYGRPFTKSLVQFLNKDWSAQESQYLAEKKLQNFLQSVIQRSNWMKDLIDEFLEKEYYVLGGEDRRSMTSVLFREAVKALKDMEGIIPDIIKKIPEEKLLKQETVLEELSRKLLEIYDPKFSYSNAKMKERMALYLQDFVNRRNDLKADICTKIKGNLQFLEQVQKYFAVYQKQIVRLKSQITAIEGERNKFHEMLNRKSNFTPIQVDYDRLYEMKERTNQEIRNDLEVNIIQFHEEKHKRNDKTIARLEEEAAKLRAEADQLRDETAKLKEQISDWKKNIPIKRDIGSQVFLINKSRGSDKIGANSASGINLFLQNVVTPFSFSFEMTGSLINILSIDKILYDYEIIRHKLNLKSFEQFLFQWFIIRTGCKKIAQIFVKNFLYSLKELKGRHKRFSIFYRICGFSGFRGRNMQEDLQGIFFSSHICWYYLIKLAMMYRKKLNENPTGFHLFPPLTCEEIFKLPLRKIYQIIEEFLKSQDIEIPNDLTQKIDHYCINQISKFKSSDEEFQKQTLQQIHILREINFDLVAGFLLEYIANLRCNVVEKLLRTIQNKQRQEGFILGYTDFEAIYKRFYRQRRAKIEQIYARLCLVNQHEMLDVQNMQSVVLLILQDEMPLRSSYQKVDSLRSLILSEKTSIMRGEKKISNPNSYQNFRERFYHQFYDFYNTTSFLEEIFKIVKVLIRKKLKKTVKNENQIEGLVDPKPKPVSPVAKRRKDSKASSKGEDDDEDEQEEEEKSEEQSKKSRATEQNKDTQDTKDELVTRLEEWGKIMTRIPHFATNVLTIDQIIIHNMRRKQMVEATEYAWRTLREILIILGNS